MSKPVGGRGKRAPYETVVMRVPAPLVSEFQKNISDFHNLCCTGLLSPREETVDMMKTLGYTQFSRTEALIAAKKILALKKSAKISMIKLLQVLYKYVDDDDLDI